MSLWNTPASDKPIDLPKIDVEKLAEIARKLRDDPKFQEELRKRLTPYQPRQLTAEELFRPIRNS